MHRMKQYTVKIFSAAMAVLFIFQFLPVIPVAHAAVTINMTGTTLNYTENGVPIYIDQGITVSSTGDFTDGYLRIALANGAAGDTLFLSSAANPNADGAVSLDGGDVYLGTGEGKRKVGQVDSTENGQNGQPLKILMSAPMSNNQFDNGTAGWTISNSKYPISGNTSNNNSYGTSIVNSGGNNYLHMTISGTTPSYGVDHGPYAVSSNFEASPGDTIAFDWKAARTSDYYDVYAFLYNGDTGTTKQLLYSRGTEITTFQTKEIYLDSSLLTQASDKLQFIFVCGSYDATGGTVIGSNMDIDNIRVQNDYSNSAVVQQIARQIMYVSSSENPPSGTRSVTVSAQDAGGSTSSTSTSVDVTAVNDQPAISVNNGLTVNEGQSGTVSAAVLTVSDPDDAPGDIAFTLTDAPDLGVLKKNNVTLNAGDGFTQADINAGTITYTHNGSETTADSFAFTAADGGEDETVPVSATAAISVTPVNDNPALVTNTGASMAEGAGATITDAMLDASDIDNGDGDIVYTVTDAPDAGTLSLNGAPLANGGTFTQTDIENGLVRYAHDGGESHSDSIGFSLGNPGYAPTMTSAFALTITAVNDQPEITVNSALSVSEGASAAITGGNLSASDPDDAQADLVYTVTAAPTHGQLILGENALSAGQSFTQDDINENRLSYLHDGSETLSDSLGFSLADGGEDGTGSRSGTLSIDIEAVNDLPLISSVDNTAIDEDHATGWLSFTVSDAETDAASLAVTASSGNTTLLPNSAIELDGTGAGRQIRLTPTANLYGAAAVHVTVTDANGASRTMTFTLTVNEVVDIPQGVTASEDDVNHVTVSWQAVPEAEGYYIERKTQDGEFERVAAVTGGAVTSWNDETAAPPVITAGTASASDGDSDDYVALGISGVSAADGQSYTYRVTAYKNGVADSQASDTDTGCRAASTLLYQWQAADEQEGAYGDLSGATATTHQDAAAVNITVPAAANLTVTMKSGEAGTLTLDWDDMTVAAGAVRWYRMKITFSGASNEDLNAGYSAPDSGYRDDTVTGYRILSAAARDGSYSELAVTGGSGYEHTGLSGNETRYYKVVVLTQAGNQSQPCDAAGGVFTLPVTPGIAAPSATQNSVSLTLDTQGNTEGTQYQVVRSASADFAGAVVIQDWAAVDNLTDTGLAEGMVYYYRAMARNADGQQTTWSGAASRITIAADPTGLSASDDLSDRVVLDWNAMQGASGYVIYRDGQYLGEVNSGSVTTYTDWTAAPPHISYSDVAATDGDHPDRVALSITAAVADGTAYSYTVVAVNGSGNSAPGAADEGHRDAQALSIQWYRADSADGDYSSLSGVTGPACADSDAPAYSVSIPQQLTAEATANTDEVRLTWQASSVTAGQFRWYRARLTSVDADNSGLITDADPGCRDDAVAAYRIYASEDGQQGSDQLLAAVASDTLSFTRTGLEPNEYGVYTVTAVTGGATESDPSGAADAYSRSQDAVDYAISGRTKYTLTLAITGASQSDHPEYKIEIFAHDDMTTALDTIDWTSETTGLTLGSYPGNKLTPGAGYDIRVTTRNLDGVENSRLLALSDEHTLIDMTVQVDSEAITHYLNAGDSFTLEGGVTDPDTIDTAVTASIDEVSAGDAVTGGNGDYALTWDTDELTEGVYTDVTITSQNADADARQTVWTGILVVDRQRPDAPGITTVEKWQSAVSQTVTVAEFGDHGDAGVDRVEYRLSGATTAGWTRYDKPFTITNQGETRIEARVIDRAGNISAVSSRTVRLDRTAPTPVIAVDNSLYRQSHGAVVTATDQYGGVVLMEYCFTQGAPYAQGSSAQWETTADGRTETLSGVDADWYINLRVTDAAGNQSLVSALLRMDNTIPQINAVGEITIVHELGGEYVDAGAIATDNLDTGIAGKMTTANTVDIWATGTYTVTYDVTDHALNAAQTVVRTVTVEDTVRPAVGAAVAGITGWCNVDVPVTITASDLAGIRKISYMAGNQTGAKVIRDGTSLTTVRTGVRNETSGLPQSGTWQFMVRENGEYTIAVMDVNGNITATRIVIDNIDKNDPSLTVALATTGGWQRSVSVDVTRSDDYSGVASIQYSFSASRTQAGTLRNLPANGIVTLSDVSGEYYLHLRIIDKAGNAVSEVYGPYRMDNTPPELTAKTTVNEADQSVDVALTAADGPGGVSRIILPDGTFIAAKTGLWKAYRTGTFTITAVDVAGNRTPATLTITQDDMPWLKAQQTALTTARPESGGETIMVHLGGVLLIDGQPIAGAMVLLEPEGIMVETDSEGAYAFYNVPSGEHTLTPILPDGKRLGGIPVTVTAGQAKGVSIGSGIEITAQDGQKVALNLNIPTDGQPVEGVDDGQGSAGTGGLSGDEDQDEKPITSTLYGAVTDQDGQPLAGALVKLVPLGVLVATDSDGLYELPNIVTGEYIIEVRDSAGEKLGEQPLLVIRDTEGTARIDEEGAVFGVRGSGARLRIDFVIDRTAAEGENAMSYTHVETADAGTGSLYQFPSVPEQILGWLTGGDAEKRQRVDVSGVITDENGNPLSNVYVQLHSVPRAVATDENGRFLFKDIALGDHELIIMDEAGTQLDAYAMHVERAQASSDGPGTVDYSGEKDIACTVQEDVATVDLSMAMGSGGVSLTGASMSENADGWSDYLAKNFELIRVDRFWRGVRSTLILLLMFGALVLLILWIARRLKKRARKEPASRLVPGTAPGGR